ncbi:CAAX prenyl protease 1 homolog [Ctenocephalides felis]|uniref:CAAX prenyl protease 1 homolog n=1 Tax=Ctenocephalides felis TaxID=7515 RepID=UPI000E6E1058|nr:CAAX prenyl protease 1 homolog [Ctenocephalides felis]
MDWSEHQVVLYGIISFLWIETLWELYLVCRQLKVYRTTLEVPQQLTHVITKETFEKSRTYALDKARFSIIQTLFSLCLTTFILYNGVFFTFWNRAQNFLQEFGYTKENEISISMVFLLFFNLFSTVLDLPFTIYYTFVLESKHGFNKQTVGFFIKDHIKQFIVMQVIFLLISAACIAIVKSGGEYFFVWLWLFAFGTSIIFMTIYPTYIAPLFDKFTPLEVGALRTSIEKLAASLSFPLEQLFVVEGSKRSVHSNAYFTGMFGAKRIVLFDTLLHKIDEDTKEEKGCNDSEILAILAHELGHWKYNHIWKRIGVMQLNLLLLFVIFSIMFKYNALYSALGFPNDVRPVLVGLLSVMQFVMAPYNTILNFFMIVLTRKHEFEADTFAVKLHFSDSLKHALLKLHKDNLGFPANDWLYSTWNHTHPTLLQRLNHIDEKKQK